MLRAAQLLSLLLSEDEEDKREQGLSLSISSLRVCNQGNCTIYDAQERCNMESIFPPLFFSAVSCSSLSGPGGQRQWSPTHDPPFVPQ